MKVQWSRIFAVAVLVITLALSGKGLAQTSPAGQQPHIIFIVADDLGWNDISWHNPEIISPNLERLAREGVILNSSYVQPVCSPSRGAFLSGKYPFHTGLQDGVIRPGQPDGLPLNLTLLPEKLKEVGYSTHIIGKWHLGFCNKNFTPTYRGFDSFVGFYVGAEGYYHHKRAGRYDFRFNERKYIEGVDGEYSTFIFRDRALEIINSHDPNTPLFIYLPFQAVHSQITVPRPYRALYPDVTSDDVQTYFGMVTAMDEVVGNITDALNSTGLLNNTLIIFKTDNGGPVGVSSNKPLRGAKKTLFEGGTRGVGFVWSETLLQKKSYTSNKMIHAVDWYPTLVHLAGGKPEPGIDGVNQWPMLSEDAPSNRTEFVYNINTNATYAAIRMGNYKLIKGEPGQFDAWYTGRNRSSKTDPDSTDTGTHGYRLYDIQSDPTEENDLSSKEQKRLEKMKARLSELARSSVPSLRSDGGSTGGNVGDTWGPGWC